jgi:hypothetical protein
MRYRLARFDGVAVDQPSLLVLDPQLAAALVADDLARPINCFGFGFRMRAACLWPSLTTSQPPRSLFGCTYLSLSLLDRFPAIAILLSIQVPATPFPIWSSSHIGLPGDGERAFCC